MKHKLESRLLGEISITSEMQRLCTTLMAQSEKLKTLLMKVKEESDKVGLNSTFRKLRSWHLPITSWEINGETVETVTDFILVDSKITADGEIGLQP